MSSALAERRYNKLYHYQKGPMKRQDYFPSRISEQILWLINFMTKLPNYETVLSLPPAHIDACVASCRYLVYVLGEWLTAVRAFGPAATSAMDLLVSGSGPAPVALPVFNPPALPSGVAPVPPGALNRLFDLVQLIKDSPGYTDIIGLDLRIIGATAAANDAAGHSMPDVKAAVVAGTANQAVRFHFHKHGHMGVVIECQRGTGPMAFLAVDTEVPYLDDRPLLVAGVPELRQYRFRYWDKGTPNGGWCELTVTVGP